MATISLSISLILFSISFFYKKLSDKSKNYLIGSGVFFQFIALFFLLTKNGGITI
jgi:hypothetical protein